MIVRIWQTEIESTLAGEYEAFLGSAVSRNGWPASGCDAVETVLDERGGPLRVGAKPVRGGPMTTRIRRARQADVAGMHSVRMSVRENQLVSTVLAEADYVEHLESSGRSWVAEESGQIVGLVAVNSRSGNVWGLFVHPDFEKRGLGRRLLDTAVGWLWSQGLTRPLADNRTRYESSTLLRGGRLVECRGHRAG